MAISFTVSGDHTISCDCKGHKTIACGIREKKKKLPIECELEICPFCAKELDKEIVGNFVRMKLENFLKCREDFYSCTDILGYVRKNLEMEKFNLLRAPDSVIERLIERLRSDPSLRGKKLLSKK